jgi:putative ubiquitin-RnfH superfamily antitoxin RatB of RatAB toxin-antitoxin module
MNVGVCYAELERQLWMRFEVPDESTVEQVIRSSGILQRFPEIDLDTQKVGIFGRLVKLDTVPREGDRIEIYRPITADPRTVRRRAMDDDEDDDD